MTIDEMIEYIEEYTSNSEVSEKIITTLRAGQAMRNCFNPIDDDDGSFWATDVKRSDLSVAGLAWDEATQEEV
jgi:hypothetical protein